MAKHPVIAELLQQSPFLAYGKEDLKKLLDRNKSQRYLFARFGYQWEDEDENSRRQLSLSLRDELRHLFQEARQSCQGSTHELNYLSLRAEAGTPVLKKIVMDILSTDLVFFDLTYPNRNVFFELGIAYATNRHLFLLVRKGEKAAIPSDLAGLAYTEYKSEDRLAFSRSTRSDIVCAMKQAIGRKLDIAKAVQQEEEE